MWHDAAAELVDQLRSQPRTTVSTGAGVSAASGVPTFRGEGGLWREHRAEELATPQAFARDPLLVWNFYAYRREVVSRCVPNAAHETLARWSQAWPGFRVVTQNVDGLHEAAGTAGLVRLHGSLWQLRCARDCPDSPSSWEDRRVPLPELPPRCPHCGGRARPGVVWFGEMLDPLDLSRAVKATACEVFVLVGTSAVVHPAAGLLEEARRRGAFTVEIDPDETPASSVVDLAVKAPAEEALPWVAARLSG